MEETREQQSLYRFLQMVIYFSVLLELALFLYAPKLFSAKGSSYPGLFSLAERLSSMVMYRDLIYSKVFTLLLISLVSIGTLGRKDKDLDVKKQIALPLGAGLSLLLGSVLVYGIPADEVLPYTSWTDLAYMCCTITGAVMVHVSMDNMSKIISFHLGKDKWNVEGESFMQDTKSFVTPYSVNIPSLFYYRKRVRKGWINIENSFRGTMLIGTPGSGKSFGVVCPFIRQLIAKEFCLCIFDFKFPDLAQVAYYHYLLARKQGKCKEFNFHVINLNEVEKSRRINPLRADYIPTLADASEMAEALVEALKKGDKSGGSDQFFTQSAVNFLAACIYFFSRHEGGRYSSLPHVLAFLNRSYEEIFGTLFSEPELASLLSPFMTAYKARALEQLEGQVGTLKIFISRLASKETFWVFSGDDFNLKISDRDHPGILVLASDPGTQSIIATCYSVVLNRLIRLINSKGNLPSGLIIDEMPTLFVHRIENLIATARSNKVAVLMGLQEMPQFRQQYGKETAATISAVVGNILSGSARNKETLDWLERLFGKVKQVSESLSIDRAKTSVSVSEKLEPLIPAGKIASLKAGELVGMLAADAMETYTGKFKTSAVHCRVNLDINAIKKEEKAYRPLPIYYQFNGRKEEVLRRNFFRITRDVQDIVAKFRSATHQQNVPRAKGSMFAGRKK